MAKNGKNHVDLTVVPEATEPEALPALKEKLIDPAMQNLSVVDNPSHTENRSPFASVMLMALSAADTFLPWGTNIMSRDMQLRQFLAQEPTLSSALYSVCVRNASFEWEIVPADPEDNPKRTIKAVTDMLNNSDWGRGWQSLLIKTYVDIYSQDNGGFWELVRAKDDPESPVIMLGHLDSAKCVRTGDPEVPVIYTDRHGKDHNLKWYNVVSIEELPMPMETLFSAQMCAVSRALKMIQIVRDILVYKHEKVSGRNPRAMDFVSGVTQPEIEAAIKYAGEQANNAGFTRFPMYHIVAGIDPTNPVAHVRIDLASLPDNFSFDDEMKWYVAILAMAFGVDYQELAPLPGGQMGSSQQSEILHLKTRGKGPAAMMTLISHLMNNGGLTPKNVRFRFKFHDIEAERAKAEAGFARAKSRAIRLDSGELDPAAARKLAVEDGDLPVWLAEEMEGRTIIPPKTARQPRDAELDEEGETRAANGNNANPLTSDQVTGGGESQPQVRTKGGMSYLEGLENEELVSESDIEKEQQAFAKQLLVIKDKK